MNTPSYRAIRLTGLGAALALLLGACGEPTTEGEQQGSVSPPAATKLAALATEPSTDSGADTLIR